MSWLRPSSGEALHYVARNAWWGGSWSSPGYKRTGLALGEPTCRVFISLSCPDFAFRPESLKEGVLAEGGQGPDFADPSKTRVRSLGWEDPLRREWKPTPVFVPGKSHGQRSPMDYHTWGREVRHD